MTNKKVRDMALYALFIAIMAILSFTPLGFIRIGVISVTVIPVFVIIMAFILGVKGGFIGGLTFGIFSLIIAYTVGSGGFDPLFRNPLVSVLPRIIFGVIAGYTSVFINKKFGQNMWKKGVLMVVCACLLSLLHTLLVLPMMYLFIPTLEEYKYFWSENSFIIFLWTTLVANGFIEMGLAGAIAPICSAPIAKFLERNY